MISATKRIRIGARLWEKRKGEKKEKTQIYHCHSLFIVNLFVLLFVSVIKTTSFAKNTAGNGGSHHGR